MTLNEHIDSVRRAEAQFEQEAFEKAAAENGLPIPPDVGFGSPYVIARYWFSLGYEAMRERGRE
jgi:hypothetical protein